MKHFLIFIAFVLLFIPAKTQEKPIFKMSEFIGVNSNVAAYDQKYLADLAKVTKWMREYHSWAHYEVADNYYRWDNITKTPYNYTWPDHNKFMDQCHQLGINVLIDVLNKPNWAGSDRGAYSTGNGSNASDYLDRLEFIGQLVARYGAQKIEQSKLETADKVTGLNYIKYYEDDNEPDYWWESPLWPAEKYAVYCNAVHDGYGVEPSEDYPLLGIKSVDSTAMHVLAGLTGNLDYLKKIVQVSNGRIPFDVLNVHTYCTDHTNAYSPENENYGLEKDLGEFVDWCFKNLPGIPVWLTEFGWDTYMHNGAHSYTYAPVQQQANYILRSYFITLKMGFEKAFLFMDKDPNSTNTLQYSSSGLLSDAGSGLTKKPSYYYLATMQNVLVDAVLDSIISYREVVDGLEVYNFSFINESHEKVFGIWTRKPNSKTDDGSTLEYTFDIGYQPEYAYIIQPKDKDMDGEKTELELTGSTVNLTLTETPLFFVVSETKTALNTKKQNNFGVKIYPNPADSEVQIRIDNPEYQKITISAHTIQGSEYGVITNRELSAGIHNFTFGKTANPGLYFITVETPGSKQTEKVILKGSKAL